MHKTGTQWTGVADGRAHGRTERWTTGPTDGWVEGPTGGVSKGRPLDRQPDGLTDGPERADGVAVWSVGRVVRWCARPSVGLSVGPSLRPHVIRLPTATDQPRPAATHRMWQTAKCGGPSGIGIGGNRLAAPVDWPDLAFLSASLKHLRHQAFAKWLVDAITGGGGGGCSEAKKKFVPKVDLQIWASDGRFQFFFLMRHFLMWGGPWYR